MSFSPFQYLNAKRGAAVSLQNLETITAFIWTDHRNAVINRGLRCGTYACHDVFGLRDFCSRDVVMCKKFVSKLGGDLRTVDFHAALRVVGADQSSGPLWNLNGEWMQRCSPLAEAGHEVHACAADTRWK
jgi:hypothetical protein